ncbi:protein-serine/threonine phosphatase [Malassezia yamatoensis]|uniref:Protein phosphatase n=1 Tax=Malassezia yamatoensis TaxID=253288 RepID=A0AAJ5YWK2_9BASI|nr:protein-serine/threonine phosphatase [Malassezia yamatoensis]
MPYVFHSAAFGIPKHRVRKRDASEKSSSIFGPIADFLIGGGDPSPKSVAMQDSEPALPSDLDHLRGKGLRSAIRDKGRIVHTRLQSQQVGEDAYFLKQDALGIADGVGGWASSKRADPALFSRLLMHFCHAELNQMDSAYLQAIQANQSSVEADPNSDVNKQWAQVDPVHILQTAWERCVRASKREGIMGSSTALLAMLRGKELRIANLGDCVLMLIRNNEMIFRSAEQQHSFNFPLQLGMMDATVESVSLASALCQHRDGDIPDGALDDELPDVNQRLNDVIHTYDGKSDKTEWDSPTEDAGYWALHVQDGDIVIMATDGLLDNLFDEDIVERVEEILTRFRTQSNNQPESKVDLPYMISESLCQMAKAASEDPRAITSPFQQQASEEGIYYVGGKNDDITVITASIAFNHEAHLNTEPWDLPESSTS